MVSPCKTLYVTSSGLFSDLSARGLIHDSTDAAALSLRLDPAQLTRDGTVAGLIKPIFELGGRGRLGGHAKFLILDS